MSPCYTLQRAVVLWCSICSWGTQANRDEPSHSDHAMGALLRTDQGEIDSNFKSSFQLGSALRRKRELSISVQGLAVELHVHPEIVPT